MDYLLISACVLALIASAVIIYRELTTVKKAPRIQSVKDGAWNDPATWDIMRTPKNGDAVIINHTVECTSDVDIKLGKM